MAGALPAAAPFLPPPPAPLATATAECVTTTSSILVPTAASSPPPHDVTIVTTAIAKRPPLPPLAAAPQQEAQIDACRRHRLLPIQGQHAIRLGNEAGIRQMLAVKKGATYSVTFSATRTCAQLEQLNVSSGLVEASATMDLHTLYNIECWDVYAHAFQAVEDISEVAFLNPGMEEDPTCGPIIDKIAINKLFVPDRPEGTTYWRNNQFSATQGCFMSIWEVVLMFFVGFVSRSVKGSTMRLHVGEIQGE